MRASTSTRGRVRVLDLLRLVATFQMVQGHTIDAVLAVDARHGGLYAAWIWLRGLTAVTFLFVTGLSFHLVALRDLKAHLRSPEAVKRRFRRAGMLVLLGYLLHAPLGALWGQRADAVWLEAQIVDVLQCIGVSLLLLESLAWLLGSASALRGVCALFIGVGLYLAPGLGRLDPSGPWRPVLNYLTPVGGSVFPLLPWAVHVWLGVLLAPVLLAPEYRAARWLLIGLGFVAGAHLLSLAGAALVALHLGRLGWVLVIGAGLECLEPASRQLPAWVWRLARETLAIYVFHVVLVYGRGAGLGAWLGARLTPAAAVLLAAMMIGLSAVVALGYRRALPSLAARTATG